MIHLLRAAIPRLGAAQLRTIQRSLPTWLDVEHLPLDETCARALARLLSAITARTITLAIRSRTAADSSDKVDSLAKPFARHAIHVLVAYVRALLSSPSSSALSATFVPSTLQRALEPGLFALCDITNSHDRDAALVGMLDSAGKTIMKRLWSSWEAQRYKGQ
ncbi:hypothetical protein K437DRAFT_184689 [Tilletiaria anomala UBC 951]|uniref:Nucleolar 27S pre-rRNA processing Urb2/Npa2 C-terminal domain-containing protein n=1 Tax=Tilletiaria anomala (strain ATCC 24038 / CBS 436.72 / UBC 951) TaxID=1037660 RepID=A0A066VG32_TILAU|nr:uncharacterized protein K437DRAFT_184689 [Tilletiaria anomala UBC 951]KDN40697.1 hypothetical protein K437DRAFT_184689 [Tilletiaria anomala UBC 951]